MKNQINILLSKPKNFDSMAYLTRFKCDFLRDIDKYTQLINGALECFKRLKDKKGYTDEELVLLLHSESENDDYECEIEKDENGKDKEVQVAYNVDWEAFQNDENAYTAIGIAKRVEELL